MRRAGRDPSRPPFPRGGVDSSFRERVSPPALLPSKHNNMLAPDGCAGESVGCWTGPPHLPRMRRPGRGVGHFHIDPVVADDLLKTPGALGRPPESRARSCSTPYEWKDDTWAHATDPRDFEDSDWFPLGSCSDDAEPGETHQHYLSDEYGPDALDVW